jgi:Tfp pilus assembly protein PilF
VLRAYPNLWSQNQDQNREASQLLGKALTADASYGRAHALLAWCLAREVVYFWCLNPEQGRARALAAVAAAATSIDDDPTALAAAGAAPSQVGDQARAGANIERALDHNNAWAWARYG